MSDIQENTEAKLAAYIDGDLDGADRAEIEKLLEQNPNYRRVLDQLRQTRQLLRALPRESAPPELCEMFNGQLERSVLLNGLTENRRPNSSLNRWPQVMMAAAIVLLTLGLGTVVYFVLPHGKPPLQVADERPRPSASEVNRAPALHAMADVEDDTPSDETAGKTEEYRDLAISGQGASDPSADVVELAQTAYQNPQVQLILNEASTPAANRNELQQKLIANGETALVMVVRSSDPRQLQKDVTTYFQNNSIAWTAAPEQVPAALNLTIARNAIEQNDAESPWERLLSNSPATQPAETHGRTGDMPNLAKEDLLRGEGAAATRPEAPAIAGVAHTADQRAAKRPSGADGGAMQLPVDNVYIAWRVSRKQVNGLNAALEGRVSTTELGEASGGRPVARMRNAYNAALDRAPSEVLTPSTQPARNAAAAGQGEDTKRSAPAPVESTADKNLADVFGKGGATQTLPSTRPLGVGNNSSANVVAGLRYFAATPSTQPAATEPTHQPHLGNDENNTDASATGALDVVIVVQNDPTPVPGPSQLSSTPQPSTQRTHSPSPGENEK